MFTDVYGHKKQIEFLNISFNSGKLAHAYIFAGPAFVGKRLLAQEFVHKLLDWPDGRDFHPDFLEVKGDDGIKIEQIRELIYKLSLRPYQAKYKVAVIDDAETMTVEAQNALLKVLEEPKSYTVIILITSNPGKLLRTILSRAQKINFGSVPVNEYENIIPTKLNQTAKNLILEYSQGKPGLAKQIAEDESFVEKLTLINIEFAKITSKDLGDKLKLAYDMADLETLDLKQVLDFWLIKFEAELLTNPGLKNARNLRQVNSARRSLDQNVNSKLLLTNLMLNLST